MEYKEITDEIELSHILKATVKEFADTVTSTMGPYGGTVILSDAFNGSKITKDGVSVAKAISFNNPIKNAIVKLLRETAEKTVEVAGDGTTTSICLLQAIIDVGFTKLRKKESFVDINKELKALEVNTLALLDAMSVKLNRLQIKDVATVSANGDTDMGELIAAAFKHSNTVKVEEGIKTIDYLEKVNGMRLPTGYIDPAFINVGEKDAIEYVNPKILFFSGKLTDIKHLRHSLSTLEGPIIIVADEVSSQVISILRNNYNKGSLQVGLMKSPGFGGHRKNLLNDLKIFTDVGDKTYGTVDSISIGSDETVITRKTVSDECKSKVKELEALRKRKKDTTSKDLLDIRIDNLKGKLSIICVGAISPVEVKEKLDRYDDAVRAVGCAVEEGILPGGGAALHDAAERLIESDIGESEFISVLSAPMNKINKNSDYVINVEQRDMMAEKIFDPTKVTKTALRNAISVARVILNTKHLVLDSSLWK